MLMIAVLSLVLPNTNAIEHSSAINSIRKCYWPLALALGKNADD